MQGHLNTDPLHLQVSRSVWAWEAHGRRNTKSPRSDTAASTYPLLASLIIRLISKEGRLTARGLELGVLICFPFCRRPKMQALLEWPALARHHQLPWVPLQKPFVTKAISFPSHSIFTCQGLLHSTAQALPGSACLFPNRKGKSSTLLDSITAKRPKKA